MTSATRSAGAALLLCALAATPAGAAGSHAHSHAHDAAVGEPGRPDAASRTIDVEMRDTDYRPAAIAVEAGETVRFRVRNSGELVHEFNIGTAAMHAAHRGEMQAMVDAGVLTADRIRHDLMGKAGDGHMMKHDDPNSVLLEPGQEAEIVWRFPKAGTLEFACNVPGHYEAGMVGRFRIGR